MKRREWMKLAAQGALASMGAGCASVAQRSDHARAQAKRPNILFCIADDASYPHMSAYGCDWVSTPGFDRVAQEGILFTRCYTPNAKCAPSRSCLLTGRNSWQLEEAANHWPMFPAKFKTYAETLGENGYHVGYTAKGWGPGKAFTEDGSPRQLLGKQYNRIKTTPPAKHISQIDYAANFSAFLDERDGDEPFCFWYGGIEPHRRYETGVGVNKGGKRIEEIDEVPSFWPDNETVRSDMLDYAYEVEYFDLHLQTMLDELERRGELDNTIVIVTADNGMPFPRIKGQAYDYSNRLPLAIMWRNGIAAPGRTVDDYVNFIDMAPTWLDVAGIGQSDSGMQPIEGRSLTDIFHSPSGGIVNLERDHALIGKERHDIGRPDDQGYPIRGIVKDDFLYVINFEPSRWPGGDPQTGYLNCDGSPTKTWLIDARKHPSTNHYWAWNFAKRPQEELYNLRVDRDCMNNLADREEYAELKRKMRLQMTAELRRQQDPRMFGQGHVFDEYEYSDANSMNFYNRFVIDGEPLKAGWVNPGDFEPDFPF